MNDEQYEYDTFTTRWYEAATEQDAKNYKKNAVIQEYAGAGWELIGEPQIVNSLSRTQFQIIMKFRRQKRETFTRR